ncbi:ATG9A protein, partial [Paradoxornis webbianus]|nr:ATG9A protein [Sinosuthora webbiana]
PPRHLLAEGPLAASLLSEDSALAPEGLVASVLAASGLVARDPRFGQPCSTASATASLLASLRNPLGTPPCGAPDSPGEHPGPEDRWGQGLSRSALLAEVASAEMSLHAIYLHQLHQQQQQQPQGPGPQPAGAWVTAGAPKHPFVTTGEHRPEGCPGGWGDTADTPQHRAGRGSAGPD